MKHKNTNAILYHKNCTDGFSAAWVARKKFGTYADFFPVEPREVPDALYSYDTVYALDTSIPKHKLEKLHARGVRVIVLDHHVSSKKDIEHADEFRFSNERSGATLAWSYFFPKKPIPLFLQYVEDIDVWRFRLPYSREIASLLNFFDFDFKMWDRYVKQFEDAAQLKKYREQGSVIFEYERKIILFIVKRSAGWVQLGKHKVLAVASPILESDIGHELAKQAPFGIVWRTRPDGCVSVSLRSNGTMDVSKIAAQYGGGGHKESAGFEVKKGEPLPWSAIGQRKRNKK